MSSSAPATPRTADEQARAVGGDRTAEPTDLRDVAAIKLLKARYMEALNRKRWAELAACLTQDVSVAFEEGQRCFQGRAAVVEYLHDGLELLNAVHFASNPRIAVAGGRTATGVWNLRYRWHDPWDNTSLHGRGVYSDRYVKIGSSWLIAYTGITPAGEGG
jgi:bile-acid 7alpha-dehydratase